MQPAHHGDQQGDGRGGHGGHREEEKDQVEHRHPISLGRRLKPPRGRGSREPVQHLTGVAWGAAPRTREPPHERSIPAAPTNEGPGRRVTAAPSRAGPGSQMTVLVACRSLMTSAFSATRLLLSG